MNLSLQAPSLARRLACWLYEGMLIFGVLFAAGCVFFIISTVLGADGPMRSILANNDALQAFSFAVLGVYFVGLWSKGQTLAMATWHITVVDRAGRPLTRSRALLRYVLSWLWFLPALAAVAPFKLSGAESVLMVLGWVCIWALLSRFHPERQFWHDALAGTRLVSQPGSGAAGPTRPAP